MLQKPSRAVGGRRWVIGGRVQGVGFCPFVCGLAQALHLSGFVRKHDGWVEIVAWSDDKTADRFLERILTEHPPIARPDLISVEPSSTPMAAGFLILPSTGGGGRDLFPHRSVYLPVSNG